jgi:hypothetical protein
MLNTAYVRILQMGGSGMTEGGEEEDRRSRRTSVRRADSFINYPQPYSFACMYV